MTTSYSIVSIDRLPQKAPRPKVAEDDQKEDLSADDEWNRHMRSLWHQGGAESLAQVSQRTETGDYLKPAQVVQERPRIVDAPGEEQGSQYQREHQADLIGLDPG